MSTPLKVRPAPPIPGRQTPASAPDHAVRRPGLVDLVVHDPDERASLLERAQNLPVVPLSLRAQYDLEMLAVGGFSPLDRFMGEADYDRVLGEMRLATATSSPIPITLPAAAGPFASTTNIALRTAQGVIAGGADHRGDLPLGPGRGGATSVRHAGLRHPLVAEMHRWRKLTPQRPSTGLEPAPPYDFQARCA